MATLNFFYHKIGQQGGGQLTEVVNLLDFAVYD